jgi:hypothetical protein
LQREVKSLSCISQRGVKSMIVAKIFPLHDAAGVKLSYCILQRGVKSLRCIMQRGVKISPLHFAAGSQIFPLHNAAGSQV